MSGSASKTERFKSVFGVVSKNVVEDRKKEVGVLVTKLEQAVTALPTTTASTHMAFHPGGKGVAETYKSLRVRLDSIGTNKDKKGVDQTEKAAFAECAAIEKQAKAALKAIPALLEGEKQLPGMKGKTGKEMDTIVEKLGGKVKSAEDKGTVIAAIKARYDLDELGGELSSKALPRLYKALSLVPANHTKDNPMFQSLVRSKMSDTSLYFNGKGALAINGGEAGPFSSEREKYTDGAGKKMEFNKFDAHTLHEVGHSVDDASGYMAKHASEASHGGWKETNSTEAAIAKGKAMVSSFPNLSPAFLRDLVTSWLGDKGKLDNALLAWKGKKGGFDSVTEAGLRNDPAVAEAERRLATVRDQVTPPFSADDKLKVDTAFGQLTDLVKLSTVAGPGKMVLVNLLKEMRDLNLSAAEAVGKMKASIDAANDPAVIKKVSADIESWGKTVQSELWFNSGEVKKVQLGGRVYQQDEKKWWSYDFASRGQMVKDYQFRSPAEWFAEVYTVAMLGKLSKSHPCASVIKDIDTTQKIT